MKIICRYAVLVAIFAWISADAMAQRGGSEGGRGGRGGGESGGRGSVGGISGGRGGFGGGDSGGRGGFGGGPPGGFGGGNTGGRGGFGGGDTGGRGGFGGGDTGGRGGFGGGPPGGGMSRLDTNGDGRIDQSELDKIPDGFKQFMESRGIKLQPGSIEEISNNMRAQFERGADPGRTEDGNDANRTAYSPASPFRPRQKERMTVDLPPKYSELDLDFDGQIGLYEWITAKRESLNEFDEIDSDVDGMLTPRELKFYDEISAAGQAKVTSYKLERVKIIDGSGAFNAKRTGDKTSEKSILSPEDRRKTEESGKNTFALMDKNRNGRVDTEEWEASSRIRPWFEKSGIQMGPMSEQEFSQNYVKAVEMMKQGGKDKEGKGERDQGDRERRR